VGFVDELWLYMKVILNDLPDILKKTELVRDMIEEDTEEIEIDERFIFNDGIIVDGKVKLSNLDDLDNFIIVSDFFGCEVPQEVYSFVHNCEFMIDPCFDRRSREKEESRRKFFDKYSESNITAKSLFMLLNTTRKTYTEGYFFYDKIDKIMEHIAKFGLMSLFEYIWNTGDRKSLINKKYNFYNTCYRLSFAIEYKNIDLLTRMLERGWTMNYPAYYQLGKCENIEILRYMIDNDLLHKNQLSSVIKGVAYDKDISVVKLCIERGVTLDSNITRYFTSGDTFEILKLLHDEHGIEFHKDCCLKSFNYFEKKNNGNFNMFKYIVDSGVEIENSVYFTAIEYDLFGWFKYAVDSKVPQGEDGEIICNCAAYFGRLKYLKYLREKNVPWNSVVLVMSMIRLNYDCMVYVLDNGCKWSPEIKQRMIYEKVIKDESDHLTWGRVHNIY